MKNTILTISRQFGSGGDEIAIELSRALSVPLYKKEDILSIAKEKGISETLFEDMDKRPTSSLLYSLVMEIKNGNQSEIDDSAGKENVFAIQSNILHSLARNGSGIFLGRCTDYIFRNAENAINIFICGNIEKRAEKVSTDLNMKILQAYDYVNKMDKQRKAFYNFYTNRSWGNIENYDLVLNMDKLSTDIAVKIILDYINLI